jgi:hypothetical protein
VLAAGSHVGQRHSPFQLAITVPVVGDPASLGPGLRTASGANRSFGEKLPPSATCAMSEESLQDRKTDLALAIAQGISLKKLGGGSYVRSYPNG